MSKNIDQRRIAGQPAIPHSFLNAVRLELERVQDFDKYPFHIPSIGHAQPHGEAFLSLLLNRLQGDGVYLFDEDFLNQHGGMLEILMSAKDND
jgi:predicted ATPase